MANILAAQDGNWSNASTWTGGVIPNATDFVYTNNRIITVDTDIYCLKLSNKAENSSVVGGSLTVNSDYILNIGTLDTGATTLINLSSNCSPTFVGTINGSTALVGRGIDNLGTGTLTVSGMVNGGFVSWSSGTNLAEGIRNSSTGSIVVYGSLMGGISATTCAVHNFGNGNVTINGNLSGHPISSGQALRVNGGGNITINGNLHGLAGFALVCLSNVGTTSTITINGNSYGPINNAGSGSAFSIASFNSNTTINGDIYGPQSTAVFALAQNIFGGSITQGTGTINIYGNIYGGRGNANTIRGLNVNTSSTLNFVGNLYGGHSPWGVGSQSGKHALHIVYCPNANLTCGVVSGGLNTLTNVRNTTSNSYGLLIEGNGTVVNLTVPELRNNTCISNPCILVNNLASTLNLTSNIYDDYIFNNGSVAIYVVGVSGILNLTGSIYGKDINVTGSTIDTARSNIALSQGTAGSIVNVSGQIVGGITGIAVYSTSGNTFATKVIGNRTGATSIAGSQYTGYAYLGVGSLSKLIAEEIEAGLQGNFPASGPVYLKDANSKITLKQYTNNNLTQNLIDALSLSQTYPLSGDVRFGVSYAGGNLIGSCYVPSASSVSYGVPIDNTVGIAVLDASSIWSFNADNLPSTGIGGRLKNCATVEAVGAQIAAFLP
jgi:hypothetical protein